MSSSPPAPSVSAPIRPRLLLLDCLRLAAAFSVVAYHYTAVFGSLFWGAPSRDVFPTLSVATAYGALGVQLFFIISGFVILMSAYGRTVGQFAASRISRLFPAYWAAVILAALLLLVISPGEMNKITWTDAVVNLTMLQQSIGVKSLDGVFWTLWVELLFYVTIAFFLWRGMTQRRVLAFIFLWPLLGMLSIQSEAGMLKTLLIPEYSPLFALGMGLYLIHAHGHDIVRWLAVAVNVVLACHQTANTFLPGMSQSTGRELSPGVTWLLILCFAAVVALITTTPLRHTGWTWMSMAGSLTYPLYLVHEMWGWWIIRSLHEAIGTWPSVAVATAASLLMAWLIHRLIERRFASRLKKALLRSLAPGSHAAESPARQPDAAPVMASL
ncbi:acyltransferase [Arthrobacter sp. Z1-9]